MKRRQGLAAFFMVVFDAPISKFMNSLTHIAISVVYLYQNEQTQFRCSLGTQSQLKDKDTAVFN